MSFITIIGIAIGLAMDATAVALATSMTLSRVTPRQVFRFAFHFGLFQTVMPVLGWLASSSFAHLIKSWDHWVAFGLLMLVGSKAIWDAFRSNVDVNQRADPTRGLSLVALSVATSIDALAVGISFAMLEIPVWYPAVVIGLVTAAMVTLAMLLGGRIGSRGGHWLKLAGGVVLIGIGVRILFQHLLA